MTTRGLVMLTVGLAASVGLGVVGGFALADRGSSAPPRATPAAVAAGPGAQLEALERAALRAMLREELLALRSTSADEPASLAQSVPVTTASRTAAAQPVAAPTPATPTQTQELQFDSARRVIDGALMQGAWTADDRVALRAVLQQVTQQQRVELMAELVPAINDGRLRVATGGSPF